MNDQQRAAMQMALEALEGGLWDYGPGQDEHDKCNEVITALREVLAQSTNSCQNSTKLVETQPQGEPVAWVAEDVCKGQFINGNPRRIWWECVEGAGMPIYTTPPSVEAAIEATKEKAAKVCDGIERKRWETMANGGKLVGWTPKDCAAAIRSMK